MPLRSSPPICERRLPVNKKLILCLLLALPGSALAQTTTYKWPSVALGGGGAIVTGVYSVPGAANNVWLRTDVGGAYRFNPPTGAWAPTRQGTWTSVTNSFPVEWSEYFACDGFAVNPVVTDMIYYAGGLDHGRSGALLKSTDSGATWKKLPVPTSLMTAGTINGNGYDRYAGERMAVSPTNRNYVLYGSRRSGLWYSDDAGETETHWKAATGLPLPVDNTDGTDTGVQCVAFDPTVAGKVYCAVSKQGTYVSTNYGASWTALTGGSSKPQRLKVGPDGTVWYTTAEPSVQMLASGSTSWTTVPVTNALSDDGPFCGLAINRLNASEIVVQQGSQGLNADGRAEGRLYRSTNKGASWTAIKYLQKDSTTNPNQKATLHTQETWFGKPFLYRFSPADLAFDPVDSTHLRGGQWYCDNFTTTPYTDWYQTEAGHEENVMLSLACPPPRTDNVPIFELIEGSGDDPGLGWMAADLGTYPSDALPHSPATTGNIKSIAYCDKMPQNMLRVGGAHFGQNGLVVSRSSNGGTSWTKIEGFPTDLLPMDMAVSSGLYSTNAVVACHRYHSSDDDGSSWLNPVAAVGPFRYTANYLTASKPEDWVEITTLPSSAATTAGANGGVDILAADRVYASTFYYLEMSTNTTDASNVWVSTDGGKTFGKRATTLPQGKSQCSLKTQPGTAGSVWVSADDFLTYKTPTPAKDGLYRSTDFGVTFNKISTVARALSFGFGVGEGGSSTPALYIYGKVSTDSRQGVFYSKDLGVNWTYISDPAQQLGDGPVLMEGSRQTPKRVFVGTVGRGVFYSVPNGGIPDAWLAQYFGQSPGANAAPDADADGTGQTNLFKYLAGLNPLDPASRFVHAVAAVPGQPTQRTLTFSPVYSGRTYTVEYSPRLSLPVWTTLSNATVSVSGTTETVTDLNADTNSRFYRVLVSMP